MITDVIFCSYQYLTYKDHIARPAQSNSITPHRGIAPYLDLPNPPIPILLSTMSSVLVKRTNPNVDEYTYDYYHLLEDKIKAAPRSDKKTIVTKTLAAAYGVYGYERVTEYMITKLLGGKPITSATAGLKKITDADAVTRCSALIVKEFLSPSVYLPPPFVIALTAIVAGGNSPGGAPPSRLTSFGTQVPLVTPCSSSSHI